MAEVERSCVNCEHSIHCDSWGDYKCLVKKIRVYEPETVGAECKDFKKMQKKNILGEVKKSKCRCSTCQKIASTED